MTTLTSDYNRLYDFELQLFVQSFCTEVLCDVDNDRKKESGTDDDGANHEVGGATAQSEKGRESKPSSRATLSKVVIESDGDDDAIESEKQPVALLPQSPSGRSNTTTGGSKRQITLSSPSSRRLSSPLQFGSRMETTNNSPSVSTPSHTSILHDAIQQLTQASTSVLDEDVGEHTTNASKIQFYLEHLGPLFASALHAKAFLQQSFVLEQREEAARKDLQRRSIKWWSACRQMAASLLHNAAREQHDARMRLGHREVVERHDIEQQEEIGRGVLHFILQTNLFGVQYARGWFEAVEHVTMDESQQRGALMSQEIAIRAHFIVAWRVAASQPYLLDEIEFAFRQCAWGDEESVGDHLDDSTMNGTLTPHRKIMMQTAAGEKTFLSNLSAILSPHHTSRPLTRAASSRPRHRPSRVDSIRTMHQVSQSMQREAREQELLEQSHIRASNVRQISSKLEVRVTHTRATEIANKRLRVLKSIDVSRQRREVLRTEREELFRTMREESRIERFAYEREGYESRHPEAVDAYKKLLIDAAEQNKIVTAESSSGRPPTPDYNGSASQALPAARSHGGRPSSSSMSSITELRRDVPCLPKHLLQPIHKKILHQTRPNSSMSQRSHVFKGLPAPRVELKRSSSANPYSSGEGFHAVRHRSDESPGDGIASSKDDASTLPLRDNNSASTNTRQPRSRTPPLEAPERTLLERCERLFDLMRTRPYQYGNPPPVLYAEDGSDATSGRNLFGDDVELHLLSNVERILRWNMRAQQALRNHQYQVAEGHLLNAVSALHNAEKERRRATRRKSQQKHSTTHLSDDGSGGEKEDVLSHSVRASSPPAGQIADPLMCVFGSLSLQNLKMLTFTNRSFLYRAMGKYRDALQDLLSVMKVEEQLQKEYDLYAEELRAEREKNSSNAHHSPPSEKRAQRQRAMVSIVGDAAEKSPEEGAVRKLIYEANLTVNPDTLLNVAALLLHVNNQRESLSYARRAIAMLSDLAAEDIHRLEGGAGGDSAAPVVLRTRSLFVSGVSALHNVAMAQSAVETTTPQEMEKRKVGKATHAAALRLGRLVLGNDHAVVHRVEEHARTIAQLLAQ